MRCLFEMSDTAQSGLERKCQLCCVVLLYKCKVYPLLFLLAGWATKCMARHSHHVVHWFVPALAGGLYILRIIFFSICRLNIYGQLSLVLRIYFVKKFLFYELKYQSQQCLTTENENFYFNNKQN